MVSEIFDVAVAGLGAMGASSLAACAQRGVRALGLDRFARNHALGASSGKTRLIRQAYFEHPAYVPLLLRAYELWSELERVTQRQIFYNTGLLMVGREDGELVRGSLRSADDFGLPIEVWNAPQIRHTYPQLLVRDGEVGVFERAGGALVPERAVEAFLALAQTHGAELRFETPVSGWSADRNGIEIHVNGSPPVRARRLILALGPWMQREVRDAGAPIIVQRNVQAWFAPTDSRYDAASFPAFLLQRDSLPAMLYGFPDFGDGVKAAFHKLGPQTSPESVERYVDDAQDVRPIVQALDDWMPGSAERFVDAKVCMYALTPDEHFIIDSHPGNGNVVLAGGFSGHGFKFASVVGEIAAQLALDGGTTHPIDFLSLRRFR